MGDYKLERTIRKIQNVQRQGFDLKTSDIIRNLYNTNHSITQIQDVILILMKEYRTRKQITRVIRAMTGESTKNLK